ncbi:hypothetical protein AQ505_21005 [Pedobacter sp. PACM 27299]|uniref:DUF1573 domain-containing protein n=1 Tax=Pedobacter sp. PACM 27299 TaxID=1727164 RepID=UPI0007066FD8|nr:DUF1573 domain-containing protein [Pedobacter sp. PACM 27299]ALL07754.1 hypothetical protein AQ505_21005 [Pedobacter sp. PACM 27299]
MKRILLIAIAAMTFASCQNTTKTAGASTEAGTTSLAEGTDPVAAADAAVMTFENENYNFGKIAPGEKVHYEYKFKNTGKSPLIISNATATCGCTIPEPPKEPILPGATGSIKVVFDSAGKFGMQDKVITVTSNANPAVAELHLTGEIKETK